MKLLLPVTCLILLFSSCSTYQYMTISSPEAKENDQQELIIENDSFLVLYNFNGANAPVNLLIQNKLDKPIYIDWKRSGLIVNERATSFMTNVVPIEGAISTGTVNWSKHFSSTYGNFYAEASLPNQLDFLPPKSYMTRSALNVSSKFEYLADSLYKKIKYKVISGDERKVEQASFTTGNSPLHFKSYLTIFTGDPAAKPLYFEHAFYVSAIIKTEMGPDNFLFMVNKEGNRFFVIGSPDY